MGKKEEEKEKENSFTDWTQSRDRNYYTTATGYRYTCISYSGGYVGSYYRLFKNLAYAVDLTCPNFVFSSTVAVVRSSVWRVFLTSALWNRNKRESER